MTDGSDHIISPKTKELPIAEPDVSGILFRCFGEKKSAHEAREECKGLGVKDLDIDDVEAAYKDLSELFGEMTKRFETYMKKKAESKCH